MLLNLRKLISKLTIFDWLAFLVVVAVLVFLGFYIFRKETWVTAEIRLTAKEWWVQRDPSPQWLPDSVKVGDQELDNRGRKVAEVTGVRVYELWSDRKDAYFTVRLRTVTSGSDKKIKFKNKPLEVGAPIELHLTNSLIQGLVVYVEGVPDKRKWEERIVEARVTTIYPWEAEAIQIGSKMKDGAGRIIAEVLEKKVEAAREIIVTSGLHTDEGERDRVTIVTTNPLKKDVTLKLKLLVSEAGGNWYFLDTQKAKVGEALWISLPEIDLKGAEILKFIDE
jgi:hypothetical protein